jgi:ABC-type transporter Mla subunit MlaD
LTEQIQSLEVDAESRATTSVTEAYINEMQAKFEEDLDGVKTKANSDLDALQKTLDSMKNQKEEASTRVQSLESQVRVMERKHEGEVESAKDEAKTEMEAEFCVLEETVKSMEMGDNELMKKVAELQAKTEADRIEYTHRVREVCAEHGKEIEELLTQLDLVEAEHNKRYKQKEKYIKEKDTIISALGSQLADSQS